MISEYRCESCKSQAVCSVKTILDKFSMDAKKQLGVDITIDNCLNYIIDDDGFVENEH